MIIRAYKKQFGSIDSLDLAANLQVRMRNHARCRLFRSERRLQSDLCRGAGFALAWKEMASQTSR
jgi:hypothetical protein